MKTKNMPEKVTLRRARAYERLTGKWPDTSVSDTKFRKGRNHRLKAPMKFLGNKDKPTGLGPGHLDDTDVYPGY